MRRVVSTACALVSLSLLGALSACAPTASIAKPTSAPETCDPNAARRLVGKPAIGDAEAKRLTGATLVRQITPGQPVTHDYRNERLTLETDPATGRIGAATCG